MILGSPKYITLETNINQLVKVYKLKMTLYNLVTQILIT